MTINVDQIVFEQTSCQLCGADEPDTLWWDHDKMFALPGKFLWARCRRCGLIYLCHRPAPASINSYYPPEYAPFRRALQDEKSILLRWARRRNVSRRCDVVERYSSRPKAHILDVGCATGIFLDAMRERGWTTTGVEINALAAKYARERLGLDVFEGDLSAAHFSENSLDVITLWDVVEHTFDPLATLREAHRILAKDGIISLTLPHWESFDRLLFGHGWIGYDSPRHLFVFPYPVLVRLLKQSGFAPVRLWCDLGGWHAFVGNLKLWFNEHIPNLSARRALSASISLPGVRLPFAPFFYLADRIGIGPTLTVVARKR
jgi:SAM-dependent methyltransferase